MAEQVKILVIDDEAIMRDGCVRILSRDGWSVITAENGEQGLQKIRSHAEEIDVILLDLMMPGMSGMEVLDRIREIDTNLPVIVITGYATVESAVEAMKKGAYDFTAKPFTPDQLRLGVMRALEKRLLQKEADFLRRERERSLRDIATEKSKIKTIINCMGDGVIVCDSDGCIVLTNPAAGLLLAVPESQLLGSLCSECNLHTDLLMTIEKSLQSADSSYTSISQELTIGEDANIYLRAHTAPVRSDTGENMGSVTVLQDISYLKELDKMKSDFIAMVAHELRAPIATIEQQLSVIINKMAGDITETQGQLLGRAKERTRGALDLIKDLLDISKIEAGKMVQYKELISLHEVIKGVVDTMTAEAQVKKINMQFFSSAATVNINADRNSIAGIFTNLISNAIKFTPEGGRILINLEDVDGFLKTCVSDTGIGIKKEDLCRIFDKFYRVKSSETRQIIGTGLGLSIVKSIVDAHLGTISVESEEGRGTTFTILFPKEATAVGCK
ncbi:MAG: response regulator [Syntrophales bacterium]|nr:response regulator [Syntrophales bacterium]